MNIWKIRALEFSNPLARLSLRTLVGSMRKWDYQAAQKPDYFIANSPNTQKRQ
jgi:hypothetical protein